MASLLATTGADIRSGNSFCALLLLPSYFDSRYVSRVRKKRKRTEKFARTSAETDRSSSQKTLDSTEVERSREILTDGTAIETTHDAVLRRSLHLPSIWN